MSVMPRDGTRSVPLLTWGRGRFGWRRVWVPSYYCQDVVQSLRSTGLEIDTYSDGPLDQVPDLGSADLGHGDVLIRMNYFGVRPVPRVDDLNRRLVAVIDDVTHDPWCPHSRTGDADWCIASLRKVLPLPDGGAVWSPTGRELPSPLPLTPECRTASLEKLAAMIMKGLYLAGAPVNKQTFRKLSMDSESRIGVGSPSGMPSWTASLLSAFPIESWRAKRRANHQVLAQNLSEVPWLTLLPPSPDQDACPFSAVLLFPTNELRDDVRQKLIGDNVFPAIVWPLDEARLGAIPERHLDFSRAHDLDPLRHALLGAGYALRCDLDPKRGRGTIAESDCFLAGTGIPAFCAMARMNLVHDQPET